MPRTDVNTKKLLTDPSFIDQNGEQTLDTTGTETITRNKTVRSSFHAFRRLVRGSSTTTLHLGTLDGRMLKAVRALGGSPSAANIINAVNNTITGTAAEGSLPSDLTARSLLSVLSDITVVRSGGGFSIDDWGDSTGLLRAPKAIKLKDALRRVCRDAATGGPIYFSTLSGDAVKAIAALNAGSATGASIIGALDGVANETSNATDLAASSIDSDIPSASNLSIFASTLRKRSGSSRDVVVENVGDNTDLNDVAKTRYSIKKTLFDMANTAGDRVHTIAGEALAAVAALNPGSATIANIVTAVQNAVQ